MSDPLKRPSIEYRQKRAEPAVLPPDTRGDAGLSISVEAAIKTLDALIDEIRDGLVTIKESMRDYAITDRGGELVKAAGRALETDTNPKSVSFHTYQSLASKEAGKAVRNVFEEKSYSAWGNASVALTHALESVRAEARRSRVFLSEGCSDDKLIESIADWAGAARMFVVDAKTIGSSTVDESLIAEIDEYRSQALEVQKANVIGAAKLANGIKGALNQIKTLYNDDANVYEDLSDIKVRPSITTNGVVGKILGLHKENVDEYRSSRLDDLDYRTEAFSEASQELLTNVAQLKLTQFVTGELAKNGGAIESDVDSIIVTSPDLAYDTKVKPAAEIIPESGVTELEARSLIDNSIEDLRIETQALISDGSTAEWHTVKVHEDLGFSTKESNDLLYSDIAHNHDLDYSDIAHDHDLAYSALGHDHDATYVNETDHTKTAHDNLDIDADTVDGSHLADILLAIYPVGAIYTSTVNTSPQTLFGGTWAPMAGRVLVGAGTITDARGEEKTLTAGATGGSFRVVLTEQQMPAHTHTENQVTWTTGSLPAGGGGGYTNEQTNTGSKGGGQPHENMQPYEVVYMWKRTA